LGGDIFFHLGIGIMSYAILNRYIITPHGQMGLSATFDIARFD